MFIQMKQKSMIMMMLRRLLIQITNFTIPLGEESCRSTIPALAASASANVVEDKFGNHLAVVLEAANELAIAIVQFDQITVNIV